MLRGLGWNLYLVPPLFVNRSLFPSYFLPQYDPHLRSRHITRLIDQVDFVTFQEAWGWTHQTLLSSLITRHNFHTYPSPPVFFGYFESAILNSAVPEVVKDVMYSSWVWLKRTGGLMTAWDMGKFDFVHGWHRTFSISATQSKKGVHAVLLREKVASNSFLMLVNTHLDAVGEFKLQQVTEIRKFLEQVIIPDLRREAAVKNMHDVDVYLMGDFNIPSHDQHMYESLLRLNSDSTDQVRLRDLYACTHPEPGDNGRDKPSYDPKKNPLAETVGARGRIDYAFQVLHLGETEFRGGSDESPMTCVDIMDELAYTPSDHFPLRISIIPAQS